MAPLADTFVAPGPSDFWQPLIGTGSFAFTRPGLEFIISVGLLIAFLVPIARGLKIVPGKAQFAAEGAYGFVRNSIAREVIGSHDFLKFLPLLFSMFVLILLNNFFGVVPFFQFPTMSRLAFPIVLTAVVYVVYHTVAIRKKGLGGYLKSLVPPGLPAPIFMNPFLFFLEFITYFVTRPMTLALRLFGNMFAGHLMLLVFTFGGEYLLLHTHGILPVTGVISFLFTIVMSFFELLIEFLQAYVFTMLAALYIAGAVADEH